METNEFTNTLNFWAQLTLGLLLVGSLLIVGTTKQINFSARCDICKKTVTALLLLRREELPEAVDKKRVIRAMHTAPDGDHIWSLTDKEKADLRNALADGLV